MLCKSHHFFAPSFSLPINFMYALIYSEFNECKIIQYLWVKRHITLKDSLKRLWTPTKYQLMKHFPESLSITMNKLLQPKFSVLNVKLYFPQFLAFFWSQPVKLFIICHTCSFFCNFFGNKGTVWTKQINVVTKDLKRIYNYFLIELKVWRITDFGKNSRTQTKLRICLFLNS